MLFTRKGVFFINLLKGKNKKIIKPEKSLDKTRELTGFWKIIMIIIAVSMSVIFIYTSGFGTFDAFIQRSLFIVFGLTLIFLVYPFNPKKGRDSRISIFDFILILLNILVFTRIIFTYDKLIMRFPYVSPVSKIDLIFGTLAILLILEATRRTMGYPLLLVTISAILFNFLGPWIPGVFSHSSCTYSFFIDHVYLTTEGILGTIIGISSTYIFIFLIFGALLEVSGLGQFFMNFVNCLVGKYQGGPAKMAVISSAIMGSITGSGVANVITTGTFTIPLMKKMGYKPDVAASIEAAASNGGQVLPPVMSEGAFIMAGFTGISYFEIIKNGAIPAILYFVPIFLFVHFSAKQYNISGIPADQVPLLKEVTRKGWHLAIPIIVLITLLVKGYTPYYAAFLCVILTFVISFRTKETSLTPLRLIEGLKISALRILTLVSAAGCAGLILGVATQTGIGIRMSAIILEITGGNLLFTIFFIGCVAYILGMGLTAATAYIITAILAAPALVELGVPLLAAHFIVFWFAQISNVTPPVCLAAYAAAAIANADPIKTGNKAIKLSIGMLIIPFLFAYTPIIFYSFETTVIEYLWYIFTLLLSLICLTITIQGYANQKLKISGRILFGLSSIGLYLPNVYAKIIGIIILAITLILYKKLIYSVPSNSISLH